MIKDRSREHALQLTFSFLLGFDKAWLLLIVGVSCVGLVSFVTIIMFIKYVVCGKNHLGRGSDDNA